MRNNEDRFFHNSRMNLFKKKVKNNFEERNFF